MKLQTILILLMFAAAVSSCSDSRANSDPSAKTDASAEKNAETSGAQEQEAPGRPALVTSQASSQDPAKMAADSSEINTMYDGFGNKTETRSFFAHSLIKLVMVRTASDGRKTAHVYGQNGQVKFLPENLVENAMTEPVDQIAHAVGITEGRKPNPSPTPEQLTTAQAPEFSERPVMSSQAPDFDATAADTAPPVQKRMPKPTNADRSDDLQKRLEIPLTKKKPYVAGQPF